MPNLKRHPKIISIPFSSIFKIETHIEETDSTQWQRVSCDTISGKSCVSYRDGVIFIVASLFSACVVFVRDAR